MPNDLARLVASSGVTFSASLHNLTPRSVFVAGHVPLGFDESVKVFMLGHAVDARVAFTPAEPPGVVLTFEATPELEAAIRAHRGPSPEDEWDDTDVTGTHDTGEAMLASHLLARIEGEDSMDLDSEDPTNPGDRALEEAEAAALVSKEDEVQEGLRQGAAPAEPGKGARLRATTQISAVGEEAD